MMTHVESVIVICLLLRPAPGLLRPRYDLATTYFA